MNKKYDIALVIFLLIIFFTCFNFNGPVQSTIADASVLDRNEFIFYERRSELFSFKIKERYEMESIHIFYEREQKRLFLLFIKLMFVFNYK